MVRQIAWVFVATLLIGFGSAQKSRADATSDVAEWLQIPMIGDYAVMHGNGWMLDRKTRQTSTDVAQRWRKLSMVARFFSDPKNIEDDQRLYQVAHMTLDAPVLEAIAKKYNDNDLFSRHWSALAFQELSEFQRRSLGQLLRTEYLADMQARVPTGPIRIVEIRQYQLGEYDFAKQQFPYLSNSGTNPAKLDAQPFEFLSLNTYASSIPVHVDSLPPVIPDALSVPVDQAEAFIATLGSEHFSKRAVYIAHLGVFKGFETRGNEMYAVVDSVAAAVYSDQDLKRGIKAFTVAQRIDPSEAEAAAAAERAAQEAAEAEAAAAAERAAQEAVEAEAVANTAEPAAPETAQADTQTPQDPYARHLATARSRVADLDLAILGVRLGMTPDQAKAALLKTQPAFEGALSDVQTVFDLLETDGTWPSQGRCSAFDLRPARRSFAESAKGVTGLARIQLAEDIIATMPAPCAPHGVQGSATMDATATLQDGKIKDAIRMYLHPSDGVIAMTRIIDVTTLRYDLRAGAAERFGAPILTAADGTAYWPSSPDIIARATLDNGVMDRCFPGKAPVGLSGSLAKLDATKLAPACGTALGAVFGDGVVTFFLFDSDRLIETRADTAQPEEPAIRIEF